MTAQEENEWEYEYDDNETEDFYVPIDLSNVPAFHGLGGGGHAQRGHPTLLRNKLRAMKAERREVANNLAVQGADDTAEPIGKIQVIGLHTENPLVMYNGQLLSCDWNKTIGTDLIFAKPKSDAGGAQQPLRSLPSVDLLATSSAKLVARVARMRPREDLFNDQPKINEDGSVEAVNASGDNQPGEVTEGASGVSPAPTTATAAPDAAAAETEVRLTSPAPSSFLGQLNAAKANRGDRSHLAISSTPNGSRLVAAKESATSAGMAGEDMDTVMGGT